MKKILLIIEKGNGKDLWGRLTYDDNLIVDSASSIGAIETRMKRSLQDLHGLDSNKIVFELVYDLTAVFSEKKYLNLSEIADILKVNRSLLAQYASGKKFPSKERAVAIQKALHDLGRDLLKIQVAVKGKKVEKGK